MNGELYASAQAEATRFFGDGPVDLWQPGARVRSWRAALRIAACAATVAVAAVGASDVPATVPSAAVPPVAVPPIRAVIEDASDDMPATATAVAPQPATVAPPAQALAITHDGGWWQVGAVAASRLQAAQELARLNGLPLHGATALLARARPLDVRWRGRDPGAAWRAVLGTEVSYALRCDAVRCSAWIVEGGDSRTGAALPAATGAAMVDGLPQPDNAAEAPPPRDRIDPPEVSHHD